MKKTTLMNKPSSQNNRFLKKLFKWPKYILLSCYIVFIGFCGVGIWLKWDDINLSPQHVADYTSHIYEEGFDAVAVTVPIPGSRNKQSFLERLSRPTPKSQLTQKPLRNDDATQTWQKYAARDVDVPENNAKVILVIDDLGIVKGVSKKMIDMDVPLTLSFLPYASGVSEQVNEAYDKGHDILVHIPMEPKGDADPGPHALLSRESAKEQMDDIDYNLNQFTHYIGINNHMGSAFTEDAEAVNQLLDVIKDKGLLVLDSKTTSKSRLEAMANEKNIPVTNRDVFLDNVRNVDYITGQLIKLEKIAKSNGTALAIGHPYSETVAALEQWIPTLKDKGITIVPISQTIKEKYSGKLIAAK